ncbi:MAG: nicotinate-nucleotide adenylyltransferase [Burkholderiales bacterium]|nr:nicotinate-nucleotide adenylyltransferase [Burkholderiales bacterium]
MALRLAPRTRLGRSAAVQRVPAPARLGRLGTRLNATRQPDAKPIAVSSAKPNAAHGAKRVGIFGGSFDPVHNAHVALARLALAELWLDELLWVPVGQPWQKQRELAPAPHREAMVRLAIAGEPRFALSRIETQRVGPSYTVETVRELQAARPGVRWFLVIGQDQYAGFHTWHGWQELLGLVTLAVVGRAASGPGGKREADPQVLRVPHEAVALPMMAESSTDIRERLAHGQGIDDLVPAPVARYIARHHLYQDLKPSQELNGHS